MVPTDRSATPPGPPKGFRVARDLPLGRHPLLAAFPGLDKLPTAARQEPNARKRYDLHDGTCVEVVKDDLWMYVAPYELPKRLRRRWSPVVSPGSDCIVIGADHLRESPELILFLDIFHELCHVQQRHGGAELFDRKVSYVDRVTEVEAYRFVVEEARRLGVEDAVIREYLRVEWVTEKEFQRLLKTLGVPAN